MDKQRLNIAPVSRVTRARDKFLRLAVQEADALKLRNPAHLTDTQRDLIAACNDWCYEQAERKAFARGSNGHG